MLLFSSFRVNVGERVTGMCGGQRTTWLSHCVGSKDQTRLFRLASESHYLLNYLTSPRTEIFHQIFLWGSCLWLDGFKGILIRMNLGSRCTVLISVTPVQRHLDLSLTSRFVVRSLFGHPDIFFFYPVPIPLILASWQTNRVMWKSMYRILTAVWYAFVPMHTWMHTPPHVAVVLFK